MKRNIAVAAVACLVAAGALAGCGGKKHAASGTSGTPATAASTTSAAGGQLDSLTAQQISDRAVAAMKALASFHASGQGMDGKTPTRMDLHLASDGECLATISHADATAHVIGTRTSTYMKGDRAFWAATSSQGDRIATALHGRWLRTPGPASANPDLKDFCSASAFMASITSDDGGTKTKGAPTVIGGQRVIPVSEKSDGSTTTVYVADSAEHPYVLRAVDSGSDGPGTMAFDSFGTPVHAVAPPAGQSVSQANLHL